VKYFGLIDVAGKNVTSRVMFARWYV